MLTVKQAAFKLGISVSLVYELCAAKKIRHERYGLGRGTIRIPAEALEEYRRSSTVSGSEPDPEQPLRAQMPELRHLRLS